MTHRTPNTPLRVAAVIATAGLVTLAGAGPASAAYEDFGVEVDATVETTYTGHVRTATFEHDSSGAAVAGPKPRIRALSLVPHLVLQRPLCFVSCKFRRSWPA